MVLQNTAVRIANGNVCRLVSFLPYKDLYDIKHIKGRMIISDISQFSEYGYELSKSKARKVRSQAMFLLTAKARVLKKGHFR